MDFNIWMWIVIGLGIVLVLGLVIWLISLFLKEEDTKEDRPFILSFFAHQHGGRAYGDVIEVEETANGTHIIKMKPKDLSLKEIREKTEIKEETVIVPKSKKITLPKGNLSKGKHIEICLPPRAEDFPEALKNTPFGKMLQFYVEIDNADKTQLDAMREGINIQSKILKDLNIGEATSEQIIRSKEFFNDMLDMLKETKKDKSPTTFSSTNFNQGSNT